MIVLLAGLVLFIGVHSVRLCAENWRQAFIARRGEGAWKIGYSVLSVLGLALIAYGYGLSRAAPVFVWNPPVAMRHPALLLTLIAFVLLAAANVPRNHIKQKLGHPMYAGVKIWALAHLLANGRLGDILLFGTFLAWAIVGFSRSRRRDRLAGVTYPPGEMRKTIVTVVAGCVAWALFAFWLHRILIGVPPI